jgi:hypothetical protein
VHPRYQELKARVEALIAAIAACEDAMVDCERDRMIIDRETERRLNEAHNRLDTLQPNIVASPVVSDLKPIAVEWAS